MVREHREVKFPGAKKQTNGSAKSCGANSLKILKLTLGDFADSLRPCRYEYNVLEAFEPSCYQQ